MCFDKKKLRLFVLVVAVVIVVIDAVVVVVAVVIVVVAVVATTVAAAATTAIALSPPPLLLSWRSSLPRGASPAVALVACARCQGIALRRERVRSVPGRITVGVRPKSQLCEPVVTRLTKN